MTNTTNFNFTIPDGTDNVNLLTQNYPNWTSLDAILKAVKDTGITTATATKTGTNFAVVRNDTDCKNFEFVATANYVAADTFTVDGVPVTATAVDGTALVSGAFVINQTVVAVLNGTVMTVLVGGGVSSIPASDVTYDNTGSGLTATDVQDAIDEVLSDIPTGFAATAITYDNSGSGLTATDVQDAIDEVVSMLPASNSISVTADGVKTYKTLFNELYALIDASKITVHTVIEVTNSSIPLVSGNIVLPLYQIVTGSSYNFGIGFATGSGTSSLRIMLSTSSDVIVTNTSQGNTVATSGSVIRVHY